MKRIIIICVLLASIFSFSPVDSQTSEPTIIKIANYSYMEAGGWSLGEFDRVTFRLEIGEGMIGSLTPFTNGSSGNFILNEIDSDVYKTAVNQFQNGVNQQIWLIVWVGEGGGGISTYETNGINGEGDLQGYYIDRVEVEVYNLELWDSDGGTNYLVSFAFVFYGYQVLEIVNPTPSHSYKTNEVLVSYEPVIDDITVFLTVNQINLGEISQAVTVKFNQIGGNILEFRVNDNFGKQLNFEFHIFLDFDDSLKTNEPVIVSGSSDDFSLSAPLLIMPFAIISRLLIVKLKQRNF